MSEQIVILSGFHKGYDDWCISIEEFGKLFELVEVYDTRVVLRNNHQRWNAKTDMIKILKRKEI